MSNDEKLTQEQWNTAIVLRLNALLEQIRLTNNLLAAMDNLIGNLLEKQNYLLDKQAQDPSSEARENWKRNNPEVARQCKLAAEAMNEKQTRYIENLAERILDLPEDEFSNFAFTELIDVEGHRLQQIGLITSVMGQLGQ